MCILLICCHFGLLEVDFCLVLAFFNNNVLFEMIVFVNQMFFYVAVCFCCWFEACFAFVVFFLCFNGRKLKKLNVWKLVFGLLLITIRLSWLMDKRQSIAESSSGRTDFKSNLNWNSSWGPSGGPNCQPQTEAPCRYEFDQIWKRIWFWSVSPYFHFEFRAFYN